MIEPKDSALVRTALTGMINAVATLRQGGQSEIANALKELTERVAGCDGSRLTRQEIIENLVFVGQQAALRPEQRNRGLLKAALTYAKSAVEGLGALPEAWNTYGRSIEDFFKF